MSDPRQRNLLPAGAWLGLLLLSAVVSAPAAVLVSRDPAIARYDGGVVDDANTTGGDEEKIRELFLNARLPGYFPPHPVEVRSRLGQVELAWHPQNGKASYVEATDTPTGAWTTIAGPISVTNSTARWQEPVTATNRFYRVRFE